MLADVSDALMVLNDRTSRRVAKQTYLVRVTDSIVALKYYSTPIAFYGRHVVLIDVKGWHTKATWRRIGQFTPAVPKGKDFLRYVIQPNGDRVLYEPGIKLTADGWVLNPMRPSVQRPIERTCRDLVRTLREYAATAVERWDAFEDAECDACTETHSEGNLDHLLERHFDEDDPVLPNPWRERARQDALNSYGDPVVKEARTAFTKYLLQEALPVLMRSAHPDFSFPTNRPQEVTA